MKRFVFGATSSNRGRGFVLLACVLAAVTLTGCDKKPARRAATEVAETPVPETPRPARKFPDVAWQIHHPSGSSSQLPAEAGKATGSVSVEAGETKVEISWAYADHQDGKDVYRVTRVVVGPVTRQEDSVKVPYAGEKVVFFKDEFGTCEVFPMKAEGL
jgi:hypothetical protein